ncbi:LytR family transcriptional regulator [Anoxybacillus ayderensis]|uniref:polyisoprenyl-teichoic acid--peptidoglycan teichoic acid transferase TagU n=1 Tax=Anoxybacillus sp. ST70 TaxID=2864180 RepID=UPI0003044828|nr:LytR family transcriptional regulator [Anoxybacillus sp. ST70]AXM89059.1 LytR family transcriptional regulator [Anoxybacillus ayderensis G10]MBW9218509.1 LytR family transcriptional regulator [Anoxybacillus sp. ST70]THD17691.1 LytR family transcriptional regulator [Anoxybacillus ayderensis]
MEANKGGKIRYKIIAIVVLLFIIAGAYAFSMYGKFKETINEMHEPIERERSEQRENELSLGKGEPISFLLIGVDERKNDRGRADSLIVVTLNPTEQSIKMLSIPRDTRTAIVGKGKEDKINHSYAFGGVEMTIATVEQFLHIPIDYYIKVNMEGFKDIVDAVGGVTVSNPFAFNYEGESFPKGEITLDGDRALKYTRMRYDDPRGDFGRQDRQKQVIAAIIKKGASLSSLVNYSDILEAIGKNVKTNMTFDEMKQIQANYKEARHHIEQLHLQGKGQKMNGIYYFIVPEEEREMISNQLKKHLNIRL